MKNMKKIVALLLATVMVMAMSISVFAQTIDYSGEGGDGAKITITNAANGETYKIAKLFDATVTGTEDGSIAYQGDIPSELASYFTKNDTTGEITATDALDLDNDDVQAALKSWAEAHVTEQAVSDGTVLEFTNLPYGYYIITTTQGETFLTIDSTNPNATVIDKNSTIPINNPKKVANDKDVFVGDTVTYTVSFDTANYSTENGGVPKQIINYIIKDDFASGVLTEVNVTSIKVGSTDLPVQQFDNGQIVIPWAETVEGSDPVTYKSLYPNKATLTITYTAKVAATAAIDGNGNINTVTIDYEDVDGNGSPSEHKVTETIFTYAFAIQKVDQSGAPLAGAEFEFPFYVNGTADTDGAYVYAGNAAGDGLVNKLTTPDSGLIIIKGVQQGTYTVNETNPPDGYNKLPGPVSATAVKTGQTTTSTTTYLDADGNIVEQETEGGSTVIVTIDELAATPSVVVNKTGVELPSTGGIGTTLFYVVGSILVIGAAVVLISKRRMAR